MKKRIFSQLHPLVIILLVGCNTEIEDPAPVGLTANVEGTSFEATDGYVVAQVSVEADGQYTFGIQAMDYEDASTGIAQVISLGFFGSDFTSLSGGAEFKDYDVTSETGVICYYFDSKNEVLGDNNYLGSLLGFSSDGATSTLLITSIDKDQQFISGEFSSVFYDQDSGKQYRITDGKFGKVPYTLGD